MVQVLLRYPSYNSTALMHSCADGVFIRTRIGRHPHHPVRRDGCMYQCRYHMQIQPSDFEGEYAREESLKVRCQHYCIC